MTDMPGVFDPNLVEYSGWSVAFTNERKNGIPFASPGSSKSFSELVDFNSKGRPNNETKYTCHVLNVLGIAGGTEVSAVVKKDR
jgi:hypothetical protein